MKVKILFVSRKSMPDGPPEARLVWDEYSMAENPDGWDEAVAKDLAAVGDDLDNHVTVEVKLPGDAIWDKFQRSLVVDGEVT